MLLFLLFPLMLSGWYVNGKNHVRYALFSENTWKIYHWIELFLSLSFDIYYLVCACIYTETCHFVVQFWKSCRYFSFICCECLCLCHSQWLSRYRIIKRRQFKRYAQQTQHALNVQTFALACCLNPFKHCLYGFCEMHFE